MLLLDEPLAGLDAPLRTAIRRELETIQRRLGLTTVLVTHDQAEALAFGDRTAVLMAGRLLQCDAPQALYDRPANLLVAGFLGTPPMDFLPALIQRDGEGLVLSLDGAAGTRLAGEPWSAPLERRGPGPVWIGVRPEAVRPAGEEQGTGLAVAGRLARIVTVGHEEIAEVALNRPAGTLHLRRRPGTGGRVGDPVELAIAPQAAAYYDPESGARL